MHENSMIQMARYRDIYVDDGEKILDVGSKCIKNQPTYKQIFTWQNYTGMDIVSGPNVDIVGWDHLLMNGYEHVVCGQVLEHVGNPFEFVQYMKYFFTKTICIIAPNAGREHRYPLDCWRIFPDGMRTLFEYAGIEPLEIYKSKADTIGIGAIYD